MLAARAAASRDEMSSFSKVDVEDPEGGSLLPMHGEVLEAQAQEVNAGEATPFLTTTSQQAQNSAPEGEGSGPRRASSCCQKFIWLWILLAVLGVLTGIAVPVAIVVAERHNNQERSRNPTQVPTAPTPTAPTPPTPPTPPPTAPTPPPTAPTPPPTAPTPPPTAPTPPPTPPTPPPTPPTPPPQLVGKDVLTGSELLGGNWGKQHDVLINELTAGGSGTPEKYRFHYGGVSAVTGKRGSAGGMRIEKCCGPNGEGKFVESVLQNVHDHVLLIEYPDKGPRPVPRRGNHHVTWFVEQFASTLLLTSYLDHGPAGQDDTQNNYWGFWLKYFQHKAGVQMQTTAAPEEAKAFLKQMFALCGGMGRAFRYVDGLTQPWMRWKTVADLSALSPAAEASFTAKLQAARFPAWMNTVGELKRNLGRLSTLDNMLGFLFVREVAREMRFGAEFFASAEQHDAFLDELFRLTLSIHHIEVAVKRDYQPRMPTGLPETTDPNHALYYMNMPKDFPLSLTYDPAAGPAATEKQADWLFWPVFHFGHDLGHLRPTCNYDHFSPHFVAASFHLGRYAIFKLLGAVLPNTGTLRWVQQNGAPPGQQIAMQHPTAQSRQRIREGITTLTLFQASLLFEHKEYQRRPGNISEIQQMFDTPFPTANLARQMSHRYRFRHQIVDGNATLVKNWGHNKTACQLALANMQSSMDPQVYTQVVADFRKALGLFT